MSDNLESVGSDLIVFGYTDDTLNKLREEAKDVHLESLDDAAGLAKVRETRLLLKKVRVAIEKRRKELKEDALRFGRNVDAEAGRLVSFIEPQEKRLQAEEDSVQREADRIAALAEQARREKAEKRLREVQAALIPGESPNLIAICEMADDQYELTLHALQRARAHYDENQERVRRMAEEDRLERLEEERKARVEREEADRARAAEARALAQAKAEHERQVRAEREAVEASKREAMESLRRDREAQERAHREQQERLDAEREQAAMERAEAEERQRLAEAELAKRREELDRRQEELIEEHFPVPLIELDADHSKTCPTCGQPWDGGAP